MMHESDTLDDKRRTLENVIQIAQKRSEPYHARLTKRVVDCEALCGAPQHDEGETTMVYWNKESIHNKTRQKKGILSQPISVPFGNYRRDRPRWVDQLF